MAEDRYITNFGAVLVKDLVIVIPSETLKKEVFVSSLADAHEKGIDVPEVTSALSELIYGCSVAPESELKSLLDDAVAKGTARCFHIQMDAIQPEWIDELSGSCVGLNIRA